MPTISVFIDEAGDPGVRDGLRYSETRHEWLCVSAVAVRSTRLADLPEWIAGMRMAANSTQAGALHYEKVSASRRASVCASLAERPCRAFVVASHKSNMREYVNDRIGAMITGGKFYNWCLRLLLERVTDWAETWLQSEVGGLDPLHVVFAQRGHNYQHFYAYIDLLKMQKEAGTIFLKGPGLAPALLERTHWRIEQAHKLAGLQLADTVASAFYQAANTASPKHDLRPAMALRPIVQDKRGICANHGVTVFPLPSQGALPDASRPIFRNYGYSF